MVFEKRGIIGIVEVRVRRTKGLGGLGDGFPQLMLSIVRIEIHDASTTGKGTRTN